MTGVSDQAAVKEYISKYQLEDELSAAVNMAIKANSDNPFKLISEYLKTLADPESDDDADDDDDDADDDDALALLAAVNRRSLVARYVIPSAGVWCVTWRCRSVKWCVLGESPRQSLTIALLVSSFHGT